MNQKLGIIEFREEVLYNLDTLITSSEIHLNQNSDFYEEVIFKCYDLYQRENSDFSINDVLKFFHIFLYSMFKHKPSVEKNDDEIKLH